jgi:hypothetical protein
MLATVVAKPFDEPGWVYEEKYDGIRVLACQEGKQVSLLSRNDIDRTGDFPEVVAAIAKLRLASLLLNGEVVVFDRKNVSRFQLLQQSKGEAFLLSRRLSASGYPKQDKRKEYFVSAEVQPGSLGIRAIYLPCDVLREHFYHLPRNNDEADGTRLYEVLRIPTSASPSELRVAFKLRESDFGRQAPVIASETPWSGRSTSWAILTCARAMTHF